ncbi:MAG: ABC transporter substrate-binding protein [Candidatus Neomarinimicrobiota bacterium]
MGLSIFSSNPLRCTGIILLCFLLAGCGQDHHVSRLNLAISSDIRGFDPALAVDIRSGQTMSLTYDNLVQFGTGTKLKPGLAHSWEVDSLGLNYIFHLRKGVKFQDGTPLNASAVIYSFQRILDPNTNSPQTWLFDRLQGAQDFMAGRTSTISGLRANDDYTVALTIREPFAPFIQYLAMPSAAIVNPGQIDNIGEEPAGSGPWILEHWERDGVLKFIRNDNYWGPRPKQKYLQFRIISEAMARTAEFEAGNLDLMDLAENDLPRWREQTEWQERIFQIENLDIWYIGLNCSRPPFNDLRLRRALNLSLDREKILDLLLNGAASPAAGPVPPSLRTDKLKPYPYDPARARELIKDAGYGSGLVTRLWVGGGSEMYYVLEALQSDWAAVGIQVDLLRSDWNVFKTAVREGKPDMYYLNWRADYPDPENFLFPLFNSIESEQKRNRYSSSHADSLIALVQTTPPGPKRRKLISLTNRFIFEEAPWVFLWHKRGHVVVQPWIENYTPKLIFNAEKYLDIRKLKREA